MSHKKIASAGFTLIELLVSLAIVGIMATGILVYMQDVFKSQVITYHLAQRTQKALIMKAHWIIQHLLQVLLPRLPFPMRK